jgi:sterol 3beta-glucosyltransferase
VIVPYAVDQPFWAHAVHARGACPRPIPARRLGVRRLALALSDALEDPIAGRAGDLGRALRREDGVAVAIQSLSTAIQQSHRRSLHVHAV